MTLAPISDMMFMKPPTVILQWMKCDYSQMWYRAAGSANLSCVSYHNGYLFEQNCPRFRGTYTNPSRFYNNLKRSNSVLYGGLASWGVWGVGHKTLSNIGERSFTKFWCIAPFRENILNHPARLHVRANLKSKRVATRLSPHHVENFKIVHLRHAQRFHDMFDLRVYW